MRPAGTKWKGFQSVNRFASTGNATGSPRARHRRREVDNQRRYIVLTLGGERRVDEGDAHCIPCMPNDHALEHLDFERVRKPVSAQKQAHGLAHVDPLHVYAHLTRGGPAAYGLE
jgi:hypothetical protein